MKRLYISLFLINLSFLLVAQSTLITPGSSQPNLITSGTSNGGVTPPRMTNAQIMAIAAPVEGSMVYDTDINCLRLYDGSNWKCQSEDPNPIITGFSNGSTGNQVGYDIEVVGDYVYLAGEFENEIIFQDDFGPIILYSGGGKDGFLAKLRKDGKAVWARQMSNALNCLANQVKVDASGNVYVAGTHRGSATISGITLNNSNNLSDIFFAKYDSLGTFQWTQLMGGAGNDTLTSMLIDNNSNLHFTGGFESTFSFFSSGGSIGASATSSGFMDLFYVKYNGLGAYLNHKVAGSGATIEVGTALEVDSFNNIFLAGYINFAVLTDAISFDGLSFSPTNPSDPVNSAGFVAKLNPASICVTLDGADCYIPDAILFKNNEIYVSSHTLITQITFGPSIIPTPIPSIKLSKFNGTMVKQWSRFSYFPNQVGNASCDFTLSDFQNKFKSDLSSGLNDLVYLSGNFFCNTIFGISDYNSLGFIEFTNFSRGKKSTGKIDAALMEYNALGEMIQMHSFGGAQTDDIKAIKATNSGEIYATGYYSNSVNWGTNNTTSMGGQDMFLLKIIK